MSFQSKIKIADLRDRVAIDHITQYNSTTTGAPENTFTEGPRMWAKLTLRIISSDGPDKDKVEQGYAVIIRRENHPIKVGDRVTWNTKVMYIRSIEDVDLFFIKLTCAYVY